MEPKHKLMATATSQGEGACNENVMDRLSNLPDEVSHHILSFLTIDELIRFSCRSKRCRDLCLSTPSLKFFGPRLSRESTCKRRVRLLNSLDRFFFQRGVNKIQNFRLHWDAHYTDENEDMPCFCADENFRITSWIQNAVRCNVEVLCFDINLYDFEEEVFAFPSCVFHCESLRFLDVIQMEGMLIRTPSFAISSNLKSLGLGNVYIEDDAFFKWMACSCKCIKELSLSGIGKIKNFIIEIPSLEKFSFYEPAGSDIFQLKICGLNLEKISIHWTFQDSPSNHLLSISASNLISLIWSGNVMNRPNLGELECLEGASIFLKPKADDFQNVSAAVSSLRRVEVLALNEATVKALFKEGIMPPQLDDIWYLSLHIGSFSDEFIPSMAFLLKGMPNLCALHIKFDRMVDLAFDGASQNLLSGQEYVYHAFKQSGFNMEYWKQQNLAFVHKLEEVTVELSDGSNGSEFVRYMLEHAETLEKMVIFYVPQQSDVVEKLKESNMVSNATIFFQENQDR